MRTLGEIAHPRVKISLFSWNGKFLVKFEQGPCEQLFKIEHLEVAGEADLRARLTESFIDQVIARFETMQTDRLGLL